LFVFGLLLLSFSPILAQTQDATAVNIYFFWGDGCPHCEEEKPFLDSLVGKYDRVNLVDYEVWYHQDNQAVLLQFSQVLGFEPSGVPVTVIGDQYWIGFREEYKAEMESALQQTMNDPNAADIGLSLANTPQNAPDAQTSAPEPTATLEASQSAVSPEPETGVDTQPQDQTINLPIFGKVNLEKESLALSTAIIGFVDGFNPCSLWVLSVLLALTLHSGSRKKILVVGLTFLIVTTIVYSLFITGVFTLFSYIGYLKWIQVGVALIALTFGVVNFKDYFWYKEGVSFTISDKHKPKLYQNMRSTVADTRSLLGLAGSSAALAVGVSFIEFSCTAGFPVIWSNLVAANQVTTLDFILLLGLYMLIYLLDELVVFITAAVTMKASRMEEKHGRLLKLASGVIMLALGMVMLINPEWMNNVGTSLLVFLAALLLTLLVSFVHRKLLPRFGILIGSEFQTDKKRKHGKR
jgi:cytochrome c biogenesis protein CcdA/glutaredoxin